MRLQICSVDSKDAEYLVDNLEQLGYNVYIAETPEGNEFYCVDILKYKRDKEITYWVKPGLKYKKFPTDITIFNFKEEEKLLV